MSPRSSRPLRGRSPTAPLLPAADPPSQLPPWSFTGSTAAAGPAADPLLPRRCQLGRHGRHRGCSPAALLLLPAAVPPLPHRCRAGRPGRPPTLFTGSTAATTRLTAAPPMSPMPPPADSTADDHRCSRCCGPPRCCPTDVAHTAPCYLCRCSMKIAPTCPIKIYTIFRNWGEYRHYISKDRIDSSYLNRCP